MSNIIGLAGFAGSGKDEAAKALVGLGYRRIAFADVLREMALAIDPFVFERAEGDGDIYIFRRLSAVIQNYGWDDAKNEFPDVRRLLQRLGTEAGRDILGENIWVDTALGRETTDKLVVTDVRFPNEVEGVRKRGGIVVQIQRPGVGPRNDHASETSLLNYEFDAVIVNNGTIDELHEKMINLTKEPV